MATSTSTTASPSPSPLVNLVQAIHLPSHKFLLTTSQSEQSANKIALHLFAHTPKSDGSRPTSENGSADGQAILNGDGRSREGSGSGSGSGSRGGSSTGNVIGYGADGNRLPSIIVWEGELDLDDIRNEEKMLADAIKTGHLHVDMPLTYIKQLSVAEHLDLKILTSDRDPSNFRMHAVPLSIGIPHLLDAVFELLDKPTAIPDKTEVRSLRSQLSQKDTEIASLSTKLASAKATVVRATASDSSNKKKLTSPIKKTTPANASALQPNAKRRRLVEDEFAGSDDE